jgi:hypothetical protein
MDISTWNLYWNRDYGGQIRANLVYTPYVSPDSKTLCMSFNRDPAYHSNLEENQQWSENDLTDRFEKEIKFHNLASESIPTLDIIDIDFDNRQVFIEWNGPDFYMLGLETPYDQILPNWKEQWLTTISKLKAMNISKFSLHPNSWVIKDDTLIPFNWFFCYHRDDVGITIRSLLKQISDSRQEKLAAVLEGMGLNLDIECKAQDLEKVCFNSFRENYPADLIEKAIWL